MRDIVDAVWKDLKPAPQGAAKALASTRASRSAEVGAKAAAKQGGAKKDGAKQSGKKQAGKEQSGKKQGAKKGSGEKGSRDKE